MLPERLKTLRLETKLTQKQIAQHFGISQQSYALWENGKRNPKHLQTIANFFNVSTDYLLGDSDIKTPVRLDDDLDIALNSFKSFDGKTMTENDRETIRDVLKEMFKDK